ncbi:tetratricopeptide repeat-containing sulfotransferase family protein [Emcibacter sp.]|uniref:tetratricopeptide repeat-containing sulfotransferase family protein n=1 Tax=Emcibacter sp. TaxID=1979954 RepID=UPI002AA6D485|nr:sulfotransferase [Emcibacter sp.]
MHAEIQHIENLLKQRKAAEALSAARALVKAEPELADGWFVLGRLLQMTADFEGMLDCAHRVRGLAPSMLGGKFQEIDALIHCGRIADALKALDKMKNTAGNSPQILSQIGEFYTVIGAFAEADKVYAAALAANKRDPRLAYNAATSAIALGDLDKAEQLFNQVLAANPHDYDVYYNRATLRKQTAEKNHIAEMQKLLATEVRDANGAVQLQFALAKELEDLGDYTRAFAHLKAGADLRAKMTNYNVKGDLAAMAAIAENMDTGFCSQAPAASDEPGPIFILGLPRTGTTLVDRILSSHSKVESLGEINDFALALMRLAKSGGNKMDLVKRSLDLDCDELGRSYLDSSRARSGMEGALLIDKTPANFLYIGLIARALPNAKIIHLKRNPMDSCFAIYKTLFRMGYPYSYRLEYLAAYYAGYHRLMDHWHTCLPDRVMDVNYEDLVSDQETVSRKMISHCGLEWEDACLDFYKNTSASATASAAQARQPIYKSSVEKWRHYEKELQPLKKALEGRGIVMGEAA